MKVWVFLSFIPSMHGHLGHLNFFKRGYIFCQGFGWNIEYAINDLSK